MNLVSINFESVPLGEPLPFALRAANGALLAQKGFVVRNAKELSEITGRGIQLCVDVDESGESYRAYVGRLQQMLMSETSLGELAAVKMSAPAAAPPPARNREERGPLDWSELQLRMTQVLRAPKAFDFRERFIQLHEDLARRCEQAPDATLLALIFLSAQETRMYSSTHAMLVSCICMVVGREMLRWPAAKVRQLGAAGLSMNIAMTELQDQLAQQTQPLTARQIAAVEDHANRSADLLAELGVRDAVWLEAVRHHHHRKPGPFNEKTEGQQMARLIQRADVFGARIAPPRSTLAHARHRGHAGQLLRRGKQGGRSRGRPGQRPGRLPARRLCAPGQPGGGRGAAPWRERYHPTRGCGHQPPGHAHGRAHPPRHLTGPMEDHRRRGPQGCAGEALAGAAAAAGVNPYGAAPCA